MTLRDVTAFRHAEPDLAPAGRPGLASGRSGLDVMRSTTVGRTDSDQQPVRDGDLGQTLLVGGLILIFLVAVGGLIYLMFMK